MNTPAKRDYLITCSTIIAVTTIIVVAFILMWAALSPAYVYLNVPLSNDFIWWETHQTVLSMVDSSGVWYVLRKCGQGSASDDGWQSVDDVVRHFERSINASGWTDRRELRKGVNTAPWMLPESEFLEQGCYEYTGRNDGSSVLLAVWPIDGPEKQFQIGLVTVQPSYWKKKMQEMD